ncbi:UNVERIFIED_CONTAM: hypothetical protein Sindi_1781600 [Sesamum indicum]
MVRQFSRNGFHLDVLSMSTYSKHLTRSHGRFSPEYFTMALNGSLHGFFPRKKGLRQGDPMSPALFLLSMEYFSRLVKRKISTSDSNFYSKCEKLEITHLLFADDLMLSSRGDLPSIHVLMECLQEFRDASGLTVNTSKSCIFTAGVRNEELDEILARTEFARGEMPVWYHGIPLAAFGHNYSPFVDWNLSAQLFREWSAFDSKFFHFQRRLSRKFTGFAGIFSGTLGGHQSLGRKFVIPKKRAVLVFGTLNHGTLRSLPVSYGTSTARQKRYGCSRSTMSTLEMLRFGNGNRRRGILHSFNGLLKFAIGWSLHLSHRRQQLNK